MSPRQVLFVGDSLTYVNDLDQHVKAIAEAADPAAILKIEREVKGGAPLSKLWKKTNAKKRIVNEGFDTVVLQEDLPETSVQDFHTHATKFDEMAKASNTAVVLLMAWSYKRLGWITTEGIAEAHADIAKKIGAQVAPAGLAWQRALEARPQIKLYAEDEEHPALHGTYLAALVVFATLWGKSPVGLPCTDTSGKLSEKDVKFLQQIAWDTVQAYQSASAETSSPSTAVVPSSSRKDLTRKIFGLLDTNADGFLDSDEFRVFAECIGFHGDDQHWAEEFACVSGQHGKRGRLRQDGFDRLVDIGTDASILCTDCSDEDLLGCLQALESRPAASISDRSTKRLRVAIVPGNGCGSVWNANWYGWLALELQKRGVTVGMKDMPDPLYAREKNWLPFISEFLADGASNLPDTIVVGHSSGAAAAMRLAEKERLAGVVLVAAYTSDLGDATEKKSGYFARPWLWDKQRQNAGFIVQFASTDDPFLPISEQRKVRDGLGLSAGTEYMELDRRSHFFDYPFIELLDVLTKRLGVAN